MRKIQIRQHAAFPDDASRGDRGVPRFGFFVIFHRYDFGCNYSSDLVNGRPIFLIFQTSRHFEGPMNYFYLFSFL